MKKTHILTLILMLTVSLGWAQTPYKLNYPDITIGNSPTGKIVLNGSNLRMPRIANGTLTDSVLTIVNGVVFKVPRSTVGGVTSFEGRTGAIEAMPTDYDAFYYPLMSNPLGYLTVAPVTSVNTRTGSVMGLEEISNKRTNLTSPNNTSYPSTLAVSDAIAAIPAAPVTSVAAKTGAVILNKFDVSLGNVDNTSDVLKPVSNPTQSALNLKANTNGSNATGTWPISVTGKASGTTFQDATSAGNITTLPIRVGENLGINNPMQNSSVILNANAKALPYIQGANAAETLAKDLLIQPDGGSLSIGKSTAPGAMLDVNGSARASANDGNANTLVRNIDVTKQSKYNASGNGSSTVITIPHGITGLTSNANVVCTPNNPASAGVTYVSLDSTNIYVNYSVAPPTGTNNLLYSVSIKQ